MKSKLPILISIAFIFRLFFVGVAHHGDLNNNISWGQELWNRGIVDYYGSPDANDWPYSAPNQPPLTILLFGGTVWVYDTVDLVSKFLNESIGLFPSSFVWFWEANGMDLVVKFPGIFADLGIGWMIYKYFKQKAKKNKQEKLEKTGLILSTIWLFNPVSWYNSSMWGQTDSVVNFLGMMGIFGLLGVIGPRYVKASKGSKLAWFAVWFTLSVLFKGSLLIFLPLLLILVIKQKYSLRDYVFACCYALFVTFLVSIWFYPRVDFPLWFIDLYQNRILPGEIGYLTANAFNFWWLVDSGNTLDSTVLFGLPARIWGMVAGIGGIVGVGYWFARGKLTDRRVFLSMALTSVITFLFMTRVHERYLYPFFPSATVLLGLIPIAQVPYVIYSVTYTLNMYHLFWAPSVQQLEALFKDYSWTAMIISVVNVLTFGFLLRHLTRTKV